MSVDKDINKVKANIKEIYERKKAAVYAICLNYAAIALNYFRAEQASGKYWTNQTNEAMNRMFTKPFKNDNELGWIMGHGVKYGVYLELANDRKHEAIRLIIQRYAGQFFQAVRDIF